MSWFTTVGGRKFVLVIIAMALVAMKNILQIDAATIDVILYIALGGAGAIALEDISKNITGTKAPTKTK